MSPTSIPLFLVKDMVKERTWYMKRSASLGDEILEDAEKDSLNHRKEKIDEYFLHRYSKLSVYQFPPKEKINMEKHFNVPKKLINYPELKKSALAVYPVLCSHSNFNEQNSVQLSEKNISIISGQSINTVREGIRNLKDCNWLSMEKKTEGKQHYWVYEVQFITKDLLPECHGDYFIFHTCIIESAVWAKLSMRAKVLYLTLRSISKFDLDLYQLVTGCSLTEDNLREEGVYRNREFDYCPVHSLSLLSSISHIDRKEIKHTMEELERYYLIESFVHGYLVFLKPKKF